MLCCLRGEACTRSGSESLFVGGWPGSSVPQICEGTAATSSLRISECEGEGRVRSGLPGPQVSFVLIEGRKVFTKALVPY